jgi:hypothetical protein
MPLSLKGKMHKERQKQRGWVEKLKRQELIKANEGEMKTGGGLARLYKSRAKHGF